MDITDTDEAVDFASHDTSLYQLTDDAVESSINSEMNAGNQHETQDEIEDIENSGVEATAPSEPEVDEKEITDESGISDASTGDNVTDAPYSQTQAVRDDKMVVNVNEIGQTKERRFKSEVEVYENQKYKFPPFDLLRDGKQRVEVDPEEQLENKRQIESTLLDFGIPITSIEATVGPTVTLYEIVPENGVKIAKIRSLTDDIALRLSANGVRIIAPIPGKGTVGIEVPNKDADRLDEDRHQVEEVSGNKIQSPDCSRLDDIE